MMVTVILDDDVVAGLQRYAIPLVDNYNSTIRKLLRLAEDAADEHFESDPTIEAKASKRERTLHVLLREGLLGPESELIFAKLRIQGPLPTSINPAALHCAVGVSPRSRQNVIWRHDRHAYSLSALTEKLRDEFGMPLVGGALNGFDFWCLPTTPNETLWELAERLGRNPRG